MDHQNTMKIARIQSTADVESVRALFAAYAKSLGIDLAFQNFETELNSLPGKYTPPGGDILLARSSEGTAIGCVALRPLQPPASCEMKRLYVVPAGRGLVRSWSEIIRCYSR